MYFEHIQQVVGIHDHSNTVHVRHRVMGFAIGTLFTLDTEDI
jgi:hypothetical protein